MAKVDEEKFVVSFDDEKISCKRPDGVTESVTWDDLQSVTVEATHAGGDAAAYIWILWGKDRATGCVFPGGAKGVSEIQKKLRSTLENWHQKQLVDAQTSTENSTYTLWHKEVLPERKKLNS